jgi:hypothetical protein
VRLIVADNFPICDLSVIGYVLELNEETCVGDLNIADALEESAHLITKNLFYKGAGGMGLS